MILNLNFDLRLIFRFSKDKGGVFAQGRRLRRGILRGSWVLLEYSFYGGASHSGAVFIKESSVPFLGARGEFELTRMRVGAFDCELSVLFLAAECSWE